MDFVKNLASGHKNTDASQGAQSTHDAKQESSGGLMDKINSLAGGGRESEKKEDLLDKGIDLFQEKVLGQGPQDNESAVEQHKDEFISDTIRSQFKKATGKDFPVADKS